MRRKKEGLEYVPTTGVKADLKRFMDKFLEYNTVSFEQFVEVWRDENMVYLCAGRATDREVREFLERVLQIAQEYFLPPCHFQVRVGGLYLLYAIHHLQPISPKVKIRLTPSQWQNSVFFRQQAAMQNLLDVVYVFQRLIQEQAFLFCYTPSEMSLLSAMKDTDEKDDSLTEEKIAVTSLFNYESLEKLSYLQYQYQQMKIELAGPEATAPDKYLSMVQTELVEDVVVLLQSFSEKVSSFSRQGHQFEAANRDDAPVGTIGSSCQMLKSQACNRLRAQTKKRQSPVSVSASFTSPANAVLPGSGDAAPVANKKVMLPVRKNTNKPGRGTRVIDPDPTDSINSDCGSDKGFVPAPKNISAQNKMRCEKKRLGDQKEITAEEKVQTKSVQNKMRWEKKRIGDQKQTPAKEKVQTKSVQNKMRLEKKRIGDQKQTPAEEKVQTKSVQNKMRWEKKRLGDQRQTPAEEQAACDNSIKLSSAKGASVGLEVVAISMPVTDTTDEDVDDCYYQKRNCVPARSARREVLAEQNAGRELPAQIAQAVRKRRREVLAEQNTGRELPAQIAQTVKKRGRPQKKPQVTWVKEVHNAQISKHALCGQENCSQGGGPPVAGNNGHAASQCKDGVLLKQKAVVKFEKTRNEEEQVLEQNAVETKSTRRRRGRPPKCDLLTKGQAVSVSELIACSDDEHKAGGKKAKYELVYFPTGMTSPRHASSNSTESGTLRATLSYADLQSGSLSQIVKKITSKVARSQLWSAPRGLTPRAAGVQKAKVDRRCQSRPDTDTEIMVGIEIGKPGVVQYQVVHKAVHVRDKLPPIPQSSFRDTMVKPKKGSTEVRKRETPYSQ